MDEKWGFMRPWCAPVRGALSIERALQQRVPHERFDGLRVELSWASAGRDRAAALRDVRQSLVLLALMARADPAAWRRALVEYCALDAESEDDALESEEFRPRFLLAPEHASGLGTNEWPGVVLREFSASVDTDKAFVAAVQRVVSMHTGTGDAGCNGVVEIPLAVRVTPAYMADQVDDMEAYARSMRDVLSEIYTVHGGCRLPGFRCDDDALALPKCVFVLGQLEVDSTQQELTPGLVDVLESMLSESDGLGVSQLAVNICAGSSANFGQDAAVRVMGTFLRCLLCRPSAMLDAVSLDCQDLSESEFARLCSAIASARSTERLTLSLDMGDSEPEERASVWEQLAFALFSKHSRSTVRHLTLFDVHISNEDADTIDSVLDAEDPSAMLFDGTTHSQHQAWTIPKGAMLWPQQMAPDEEIFGQASWTLEEDVEHVTVLDGRAGSSSVRVLAPGYGVCTTNRSGLVARSMSRGETQAPKTPVTALTLMFESGSPNAHEGLPRLLERIGKHLTFLWLEIFAFGDQLLVENLLRWCPNLTTLVIHGIVVDTASFLRGYRDSNLRLCELKCEFDDFSLLVNELADASSLLARKLRSLSYAFSSGGPLVAVPQFATIGKMLQQNRTLEYLDLMVSVSFADQASTTLQEHHREPLPVAREPLPLPCRLAFISIFSGLTTDNREGASPKRAKSEPVAVPVHRLPEALDCHVIGKIFEFAAPCVMRKVYVLHYCRRVA